MSHIPNKPNFVLSDAEYDYICKRDGHQCVFRSQCQEDCDTHLQFDHKHPQSLGGDDSYVNLRLMCGVRNAGRPVEPDGKWLAPNFWDAPVDPNKLRHVQRIPAWDEIDKLVADGLPIPQQHLRRALLSTVTLIPGATGIGKTILLESALCKVNAVIGIGFPRVKHALWLTNETQLREQGRDEIASDAFDWGFFSSRPIVNAASSFTQLMLGPQGSDVTVATVESLWIVKKGETGLRRSDAEKRAVLEPFDTIIFDECDWGNDQVRAISKLATHALKFALTATPIVNGAAQQDFIKRFALISEDAVADYLTARNFDGCLKWLREPIVAATHDSFEGQQAGAAFTNTGVMPRNHVSYLNTISDAVRDADRLETEMRALRPNDFYSPHIMVRMENIKSIQEMLRSLRERLFEWRSRGILLNEGWDVTAVFQGSESWNELQRDERQLSARFGGKWLHPFMLAKNSDGRATERSKRILLMCNIGVRGLNNWTINTFVNCSNFWDPVSLLQGDLGRTLRWPANRVDWIPNDELREFCEVRTYVPQGSDTEEYLAQMAEARTFIDTMKQQIPAMGFLTWADLAAGRHPDDDDVNINTKARPLETAEKIRLQSLIADVSADGFPVDSRVVESIVETTFPDEPGSVKTRLRDYGEKLATNRDFRLSEMTSAPTLERNRESGILVMAKLHPQEQFDVPSLLRWAQGDAHFRSRLAQLQDILSDPTRPEYEWAAMAVADRIHQAQLDNYRPLVRRYRLQGEGGVLPEIAAELSHALYSSGFTLNGNKGLVPKYINAAAKDLYGVDSVQEGQALDHPAYHLAILLQHRTKLQKIAYGMLVENGQLGANLQRFASR